MIQAFGKQFSSFFLKKMFKKVNAYFSYDTTFLLRYLPKRSENTCPGYRKTYNQMFLLTVFMIVKCCK